MPTDDITDNPKPVSAHNLARQPASDQANEQDHKEAFN